MAKDENRSDVLYINRILTGVVALSQDRTGRTKLDRKIHTQITNNRKDPDREGEHNESKAIHNDEFSRSYGGQHSSLSSGSGDADGTAWRATAERFEAIRQELHRAGHLSTRVRGGGLVDAGHDQARYAPCFI